MREMERDGESNLKIIHHCDDTEIDMAKKTKNNIKIVYFPFVFFIISKMMCD